MDKITKIDTSVQLRTIPFNIRPNYNFLFAAGKSKQIINDELFSGKKEETSNENRVNTPVPVKDFLRARGSVYWTFSGNSFLLQNISKTKSAYEINVEDKIVSLEDDEDNKGIFNETTQKLTLTANKYLFTYNPGNPLVKTSTYNPEYWKSFIINISEPLTVTASPLLLTEALTDVTLSPVDIRQQSITFSSITRNVDLVHDNEILSHQKREEDNKKIALLQNGGFVDRHQLSFITPLIQSRTNSTISETEVQGSVANAVVQQNQQTQNITAPGIVNIQSAQDTRALAGTFVQAIDNQNQQQQEASGVRVSRLLPPPSFNVVPTIQPDMIYYDHVFEMNVPYDKKILDSLSLPIKALYADIRPTYNFYIKDYENVTNNVNIKEQILPSMYTFCTELQNENTDAKNTIFQQHITLAGIIKDEFVDVTNNRGQKIGEKDKGQYFDKFSQALPEMLRTKVTEENFLRRRFTNQIAPIDNIQLFKEFNEKRELFPMYWDTTFSTDNSTQFAKVFEETKFFSLFIRDFVENTIPTEELIAQETLSEIVRKDEKLEQLLSSDKKIFKSWDVVRWLEKLSDDPLRTFSTLQEGVFLGSLNKEIEITSNSQYDLYRSLLFVIFIGKIKEIINVHLRSFDDIKKGKMAYSETLFYKVEKREAGSGEVIQNFYLPNSSDVDIYRFIDTQVKYNKQYNYKIYAYQMVLGNKYRYQFDSITDDTATVYFVNSVKLKLVEVLYHDFTGRILDRPPVPPDIMTIPYKGINNQILFFMNSGVGEYKLHPIILEPKDEEVIKLLREAQKVTEKEKLEYSSDDHAAFFEIYRINKKPKSYKDFSGNRIVSIKTDIDAVSLQEATAASFIDSIIPNRKYYYIFRTIDNHGHISNPTDVYEIEMVDADGSIYPIVKTVEFESPLDTMAQFKTFRKFLKIKPAFNQRIVNEEKSGFIDKGVRADSILDKNNIHLGLNDEVVWGKNYKIRLTSKQTGKKIDFNINLSHNHIKKVD